MPASNANKAWDVLFYVQHLLGIGHLQRAAVLANALHRDGLRVRVVMGGPEVEQVSFEGPDVVALPAIRALDESFTLVDENGECIDRTFKDRRRSILLDTFEETRPTLLLTELFPFGRRQMRFELLPLLERAKECGWHPAVACS
ncbi:MAG: hypothetical protein R3245_09180, partial [Kiloniellales bacterium]|nr:hypothetical protein [Kiloniellales bacterium]